MEKQMNDLMGIAEFLNEAKRRRTEAEQERLREEAQQIAENRAAWGRVLDHVRSQLPDILRSFVVVTDPNVMDEAPDFASAPFVQLRVPLCTPITLAFKFRSWDIEAFWPRMAINIEEDEDGGGPPYLRSQAYEKWDDIYLAVATAHEHYARWSELEDKLDRYLNWAAAQAETPANTNVTVLPIYGIDGLKVDV